MKISILLSTYNGENYLKNQIDSILNQTYTEFKLIIRDDGSTDKTRELLNSYLSLDSRINILEYGTNIGVVASFSKLLESADSDYFFFCDQDDIWELDKIKFQLDTLTKMEEKFGKDTPCLTHSDLSVIDSDEKPIHHSLWEYGKINPYRNTPNYLLIQPIVTGCAMAGNRALSNLLKPIPDGVFMHDWWASLIASFYGRITPSPNSTIKYRVHLNNRLGMSKAGLWNSIVSYKLDKYREFYDATLSQAKSFIEKFSKNQDEKMEMIKDFASLKDKNIFEKFLILNKYHIYRSNIVRNLAFQIYTLFI